MHCRKWQFPGAEGSTKKIRQNLSRWDLIWFERYFIFSCSNKSTKKEGGPETSYDVVMWRAKKRG
jgi:hypothetical protein